MKTLHLSIITTSGILAVIVPAAVFFLPSAILGTHQHVELQALDLSNPATDNPLGITASVVVEKDKYIMCPVKCNIPPTPHLVLRSHRGAEFVGYKVCDGNSCKAGRLSDSVNASLGNITQNYSGPISLTPSDINLGDLPWQTGDTVHVIVKAFPVTLKPNDTLVRHPEKTMVVDLGESKIISADDIMTNISTVIVPNDTAGPDSGKNYEPRHLVVVLGVNNTVRWTNESPIPAPPIMAENHDDPLFWNATHSPNNIFLLPGKSFNFTFTKTGEFQYDTVVHSWMFGWVLVLPQYTENAIQTVTLNASSGIPDPCETFAIPCPFHPDNYNFTAQKLGSDIYIEKFTVNGVENYAIIKPDNTCYYPPTYRNSCTNPGDLAILRLVGVDTSIRQENIHLAITGLAPYYVIGEPIDFGISIKGYGNCDIPSVLVTHEGYIDWQSKTSWPSDTTPCMAGLHPLDRKYDIGYLGGPIYLNKSGTYLVHVGYSSNMTEERFNVISQGGSGAIPLTYQNGTFAGHMINYSITGQNSLLGITLADKLDAIILSTYSTSDGNLTVTFKHDLVSLLEKGKDETPNIVLEDGVEEINYTQYWSNQDLVITIPFHNGTKEIEIIATEIV